MAFENRKNGRYFYAKERIGARVVSMYIGTGKVAELAAKLQTAVSGEREMKRTLEQMDIAAMVAEDAEDEKLDEAVGHLVKSTLIAEGYHQHKGTWRKRRNEKDDAIPEADA